MNTDDILDTIDSATHPDLMSKTEALEYLQEISALLDGRIEALVEEIEGSEE